MLSESQLQSFHEQGYLKIPQFIDGQTLARLQMETEALHEEMAQLAIEEDRVGPNSNLKNGAGIAWEEDLEAGKLRIRQLINSECVCPSIAEILESESMLSVIRQLSGEQDIIKFNSKLLMQPARDGSFTPWHQEWGYWQSYRKDPSQINCMLSIDPATLENGCVRFVAGSHKAGSIEHGTVPSASFSIGLEGDIDAYDATPVETEAGDAVFFGSLIIHGSAPNKSNQERRANTFAYDKANNTLDEENEEPLLK